MGRFGALEELVEVGGGASEMITKGRPIRHEAACLDEFLYLVHRWQPVLHREFHEGFDVRNQDRGGQNYKGLGAPLNSGFKRTREIVGTAHRQGLKR